MKVSKASPLKTAKGDGTKAPTGGQRSSTVPPQPQPQHTGTHGRPGGTTTAGAATSQEGKLPLPLPPAGEEHHNVIGPMVHRFTYTPETVDIPIKVLFNDYTGVRPKPVLNLANWRVNHELFGIIASRCGDVCR